MSHREKDKEKERARARQYMADRYRQDPEFRAQAKVKAREWAKNNPDKVREQRRKRREWLKEYRPEVWRSRLDKRAAVTRKWQAKNKEHQSEYQKRRLGERIELFKRIKMERGCAHCGMKDWRCLEFHHRDPSEKEFTLATAKGTTMKRLEAEIAKCEVVCANCHRIHHTSKDWT